MFYYLAEQINSTVERKDVYGQAGEVVICIADHTGVMIVEGEDGRFPVHNSKLILIPMSEDLQKFHKIFGREKVKPLAGKLEYRVGDLEGSVAEARRIIEANQLKLEVVSSGHMATYKAFEVKEL